MNRILRFLRNLDKRKLIFILQRASAVLLPIRPIQTVDAALPLSGHEAQAHAGHRHRRQDRQRPYETVNWDLQAAVRLGIRCGVPPRQTQIDNIASGSPQLVKIAPIGVS